ncbi:MAG TPA: bifunctional ornithine acetyltransferase/N-acetylglutamate synthase, partial [Spirochaetota bacterium]|nr:bifunctional ornithine acetyltransferase/N-acetylglutamate synthase [Spirochaetota bacterium]
KGTPTEQDLKELESVLKRRNYTITIDVGLGNGESIMWTSDLSFDYVKINAEYST